MGFSFIYGHSSLSFSLGKMAVENGAVPFGVSQFQFMVAGVALLLITLIRKKPALDNPKINWDLSLLLRY